MKENIICSDSSILKLLNSDKESEIDKGLNCLFRNCGKIILKFILANKGTEDEAKDVIQDSIIVFYEQVKNKNLVLDCTINTYMYSVSRNLWLKKLAYKSRFINELSEYIVIDNVLTEGFDDDIRNNKFIKLFNELGESCRVILLYYYYDKLSMKEIMIRMNFKSEQAAKNKKYKCLNYLREIVLNNKDFRNHISDN